VNAAFVGIFNTAQQQVDALVEEVGRGIRRAEQDVRLGLIGTDDAAPYGVARPLEGGCRFG
jgi:hypothetical protein